MIIALIVHQFDKRDFRTAFFGRWVRDEKTAQIHDVLLVLRQGGHRYFLTTPDAPFRRADLAIMHVDVTQVPQEYADLADRYPRTINARVLDISKRGIGAELLSPDSAWDGPVIIKTDLNAGGALEALMNRWAMKRGAAPPYDTRIAQREYQVLASLAEVPNDVWADPGLIVQPFRGERSGENHVLRVWSFLGGYERCSFYESPDRIIKGTGIVRFGPSPVPDELRAIRERLGFDYGKFDFAISEGKPVLFDANKTPGVLVGRPELVAAEAPRMARAVLDFARG